MSKSIAPVMFTFILFLTLNPPQSAAVALDDLDNDFCTDLAAARLVKADEDDWNEELYYCHPSIPNAYLMCVIGKSKKGKNLSEVLEERELVCGANGFFNTDLKACMPHLLSDCAQKFAKHPVTDEQRICGAYRLSQPETYSNVASLICPDKEKQMFVVCPLNTASAVFVPCINGTFFSQALGRCVEKEEDSDCPIEWKEMERGITDVGEMTKVSPQCKCVCNAVISGSSKSVIYIAHPRDDNQFLICLRNGQIHRGSCPRNLSWNDNLGSCDSVRFRKSVPQCGGMPPLTLRPMATPSTGGQHGCIDCALSARQRCECRKALQQSGKLVIRICDPESKDRYLVCMRPNNVVCQPCAKGTMWNRNSDACAPVRSCDPWRCLPTTTTTPPTTTSTTTTPPTTSTTTTTTTTTRWVPKPTTPRPTWPRPTYKPTEPPTTRAPITLPPTYPPVYCEYFYEFHPEKMNWNSARRVCEANQGTLATIPDQSTQSLLRDRFGSTSKHERYWVGASDRGFEGNWEWVTGERFGYTNWYRNQPSMKRYEDCLGFNFHHKGAWSDELCDLERKFICQNLVCAK